MSTASSAERAPPGKSLMSKAICSSAPSRSSSSTGTSGSTVASGPCADWSLIVCSCPRGGGAARLLGIVRDLVGLVGVLCLIGVVGVVGLVELVELVVDGDVAGLGAGPPDV